MSDNPDFEVKPIPGEQEPEDGAALEPSSPPADAAILQRVERQNAFNRSVSWFYWIGGLSLVNSIAFLVEADFGFFFGLGVTQFADAIIAGITDGMEGGVVTVLKGIGLLFSLVAAFMCFLFAWAGKRGSMGVYKLGMVLYGLDALLFLLVGDWLGLGFHAFALFAMSGAFKNAPDKIAAELGGPVAAVPGAAIEQPAAES